MIRVTIDVIPHGVESKKHTIGQFAIWNTGEQPEENVYKYEYKGFENLLEGGSKGFEGFVYHNRKEDVITLIKRVLSYCILKE